MRTVSLLVTAATWLAPQPANQPASKAPDKDAAEAHRASSFGTWRITHVDGRPAQSLHLEGPTLTLRNGSYEGSTGCNGFGGTSIVHAGRFFANWPIASERGGTLTAQEEAIFRLLISGPRREWAGRDSLALTAREGRLRLERVGAAAPGNAVAISPMLLAGTRWTIFGANGKQVATTRAATPTLGFEADDWSLSLLCGTVTGRWHQRVDVPVLNIAPIPSACAGDATAKVISMMHGPLAYTARPNREFVLAGENNFLVGRFDRSLIDHDAALLTGKWLVRAIDGRQPGRSRVPPNIIFGRASYAVWDGCNQREGLQLTHARQLFTYGSGLSTLANCRSEQISPQVHTVLGGQPRIARTKDGLALISRAGRLDLQRISGRLFGGQERTGLRPGMTIELAGKGGSARLKLVDAHRFSIVLSCGTLQGDWRPGQPAGFSLEPAERHAPNCPAGAGGLVWQMQRMFQGDVQAVVDGNNEHVLLLNEDRALTGGVVRQ